MSACDNWPRKPWATHALAEWHALRTGVLPIASPGKLLFNPPATLQVVGIVLSDTMLEATAVPKAGNHLAPNRMENHALALLSYQT